ncbi:hypothetical protein Poli38472_003078 [Pythium oligandrum]|uniref:Uncharacterized protein n=1 Tax=Pythium oligandrum TaxID=41045 RepID=A0A8K1C663_PYTOL|nr:hypothetical protein Poli38472_003078 [Pythium oligandrum]|eukprot:TMW57153.1 hypothetical protein Poli38472_003078 [Pythium oligandrum]
MGSTEERTEARGLRPEGVVFAKTVSRRKLGAPLLRPGSGNGSVLGSRRNMSTRRLEDTGPRRPSTAASTHSRIHQALRRSESEFVFSSKASTVDGFLYSSRFEQTASQHPSSSAVVVVASSPIQRHHKARRRRSPTRESPPTPQEANEVPSSAHALSTEVTTSPGPSANQELSPRSERKRRLLEHKRRQLKNRVSTVEAEARLLAAEEDETQVVRQFDETEFMQRKRRCARTFEEMIMARVKLEGDTLDPQNQEDIQRLLENGIVQLIVTLSNIVDAMTHAHCCRALFHLSQVPFARKCMVTHGVVTTAKLLSRTATANTRQDLAAMLCHLSEEHGLIEPMLYEGYDRSLVRLFTTTNPETKRICALAVFNLSSDAIKLKHFVDGFAQLLISATKNCYGHTAASGYLIKAVYNVALVPSFRPSLLGENIPRFLSTQLPSVAESIKILALKALVSLCDVKTNRLQILSQSFCSLLEKMLASPHPEVQEMTLLELLLLSTDEGSRIKLCNWVPARAMVQAALRHLDQVDPESEDSVTSLVYLDSCIFRNLCDSVLTHHELVEEGIVHVLLQMSHMHNREIRSNALCALCSVIASSTVEACEFVCAITEQLIDLTFSPQLETCLFATGAIYNITCSDECLPVLSKMPTLFDRIFELAKNPPHERIAERVAAIMYRMTTLEGAQKKLLGLGFFSVLAGLIKHHACARTNAVNALYMLADADDDESFPNGDEEIQYLINALSGDLDGNKPKSVSSCISDLAGARSAVSLVAHLARHQQNHSILVKNGAVFRFLRSLRHWGDPGDETIVMNCALVYYSLTVTQEGCEQLIREDGIEQLIHISRTTKLDTANNIQLREIFMKTICRISSFIGLEVRLIEHGAIDAVMVLALVATDNPSIKASCVKILANCLVSKNCVRPLIEHGAIWALSTLAVVDSHDTRLACAVSLCNLGTVPFMLSRFLDAGAPRALIHLLQKSEDTHTTLVVVKAIANLVANEKICLAFTNEDIEKHLGAHFSNPRSSEELRQLAAMILLRVTSANDAMISLDHLKHGVFVWLEQIVLMEDVALVRSCMLTVHDLTCNSTIDIAELDVDHILRIVVQVFSRHAQQADVITLCLWIIYNLSCQLVVLHALVSPEIVKFIQNQVPAAPTHANVDTIMESRSAAISTVNSPAPSTPVLSQDIKLCCFILHNISCARITPGSQHPETLAALVDGHCTRTLHDIYFQRDDLKEVCAIALCNLAVGRVNTTNVVDDHAGDVLVHFVFSDLFHRTHHRLVSVAFRRVINAPGNQPRLLAQGASKAMAHILKLTDSDLETVRNLMASLSLLSRSKMYLKTLLHDGVLPVVINICESLTSSRPLTPTQSGILGFCFELLSNLCTIPFEGFLHDRKDINVIQTLTRLSEQQHTVLVSHGSKATTCYEYYERGECKPLAYGQLLTFMMKTPSISVKKNLELQATYQVPARKWIPDGDPSPRDPPAVECNEIPLTEGSQSIPDEVRLRIRALTPLEKERLVRDEQATLDAHNSALRASHSAPSEQPTSVIVSPSMARRASHAKLDVINPKFTLTKKLQRGNAGRNLSIALSSAGLPL